jgi:flavodoxin
MRRKYILWLVVLLTCFCSCSKAQRVTGSNKILIVYLSRTNNTKAVAEMIHKNVGGTLVSLELVTPYPANYRTTVGQVVRENQTGYLPPLQTKIDSIATYETVFIGFPTWGMKLPPPIKSFLKQYDLKEKTVIPFNTNGGYGKGSSFETVSELCTGCKIAEGYSTTGGFEIDGRLLMIKDEKAAQVEKEVQQWLKKINMLN